jgi:hypothetical protein
MRFGLHMMMMDHRCHDLQFPCEKCKLGLHTVPSDGYGHTIDGQMTGMVHPSTVHQVWSREPQQLQDGYGDGRCTVDNIRQNLKMLTNSVECSRSMFNILVLPSVYQYLQLTSKGGMCFFFLSSLN